MVACVEVTLDDRLPGVEPGDEELGGEELGDEELVGEELDGGTPGVERSDEELEGGTPGVRLLGDAILGITMINDIAVRS